MKKKVKPEFSPIYQSNIIIPDDRVLHYAVADIRALITEWNRVAHIKANRNLCTALGIDFSIFQPNSVCLLVYFR